MWDEAREAPGTDRQALNAPLRNFAFVLRAVGSRSSVLWRGMM